MWNSQSLRDIRPYRWLWVAALGAVLLAQVVALVMVTRSQVRKAEAHYAAQRPSTSTSIPAPTASIDASSAGRGVMQVGYVVSR